MSEYIIKAHQPHPQLATDPEQKLHQVFDWKQQKEIWKRLIDRYHRNTRRIPSPA